MSAKQSLNYSNQVRQEVVVRLRRVRRTLRANLSSPDRGKTLKPRSEKSEYSWKRLYSKRLDKVINPVKAEERMRRKRPGCNESEPAYRTGRHRSSLVKIRNRDGRDVIL